MQDVNVDFLTPNGRGGYTAEGPTAAALSDAVLNINQLRTNDTLRKDEWLEIDRAVVQIARDRLIGVADLVSAGLTINLANGLGTTVFQWEDMSDMTEANVNMEGITEGDRDRVTFDLNSIPLPIVHKDFYISKRVLQASRTLGQPLDITQAEVAAKLVSEKVEQILFTGSSSLTFGGGTLYGYTDFPDRNTFTIPAAWDASATTGSDMLRDLLDMLALLHADRMFGPYVMYLPTLYWTRMQDDFKTNSDRMILERLQAVSGITAIKPADTLSANNVVLTQMSADNTKMVIGLQPTVVQWETQGGMRLHFKVMTIMVPRVASTQTTQSGIVHASV